MIFIDGTSKEEPFKTTELREKIRGEDVFKNFRAVVLEMNIAIQQLAELPQTSHQLRLVKIFALLGFATNIPLSTFFHLPLCYFSEGPVYTSDLFSTLIECSAKFVKSLRIVPFQHRLFRHQYTKMMPVIKICYYLQKSVSYVEENLFSSGNCGVSPEKQFTPTITRFSALLMLLSSQFLQPN
jgi:hypothetical protein